MKIFLSLLILAVAGIGCNSKNAQRSVYQSADEMHAAINNQHYSFLATSATSQSGRNRQLTSSYSLTVKKDTVTAYLPYFGVAYTAPMDPSKGGIDFTSTQFNYTKSDGRKGGYTINIAFKDVSNVLQMFLSLTSSGYGTLQVTSRNRQPISFYGHLEKIK